LLFALCTADADAEDTAAKADAVAKGDVTAALTNLERHTNSVRCDASLVSLHLPDCSCH
jgi:hypothetical protein